jgi:hypothetical protein
MTLGMTFMRRRTWTTPMRLSRRASQISPGAIHHPPVPSSVQSLPQLRLPEAPVCRHLVTELGFEGIRFDFSKGYDGKYAGKYARAALADDQMAVGEYWVPLRYDDTVMKRDQEDNRRQVGEWIDASGGRCLAFDFSTKGLLQVRTSACPAHSWASCLTSHLCSHSVRLLCNPVQCLCSQCNAQNP